ncbi:MAG: copper resistance CopC family protein [Gammaproteobacteria bacterium]
MFRNLVVVVVLSLWHPGLSAHAFLERAEPAPGSVSTGAPTEIRLAFDSALEHAFCAVRVEDSSGGVVATGEIQHARENPDRLAVSLPRLGSGTYQVRWSVVSWDGHQTEGDYRFTLE